MRNAPSRASISASVLASLVAATSSCLATPDGESPNLLVNGDFEESVWGGCPDQCYTSCGFGTPGWMRGPSIIHTDLEQNLVSEQCGPYLVNGGQYRISLQGAVCCPCDNNGWIEQPVTLVPGVTYRIEMDVLLDPFDAMRVTCGGSQFEVAPGGSIVENEWSHVVLDFVAGMSSSVMRIESIGPGGLPNCMSASSAGLDNVSLAAVQASNGAIQWRVQDGGNGHWYALVEQTASWTAHRNMALAKGGDLATLTSASENEFIVARFWPAWVWLGGTASLGSGCNLGTWKWVTGEPWEFVNWAPGEPNNCNETRLTFATNGLPGQWNNHYDAFPYGAIYEWSADCNGDGIVDFGQIAEGVLQDANEDGVPDCCQSDGTCCTTAGEAYWSVALLNPVGSTESGAYAASGAQQVGSATVGGIKRASLWNGTAESWVSLHPVGTSASEAWATSGGQQVGWAQIGGAQRASLWSGTAASWVSLHPAGATSSQANATTGAQQVGYATVGGVSRASLWNGTADSWVSLHPAGASSSVAFAAHGTQQVGSVTFDGIIRAALWSGTAASWVDLNPAGADYSRVWATNGSQQAGTATVANLARASLWSGTAASWVDLSPSGSLGSRAYAMNDAHQVGYAIVGGTTRASLWSGTAASWQDLHALLPTEFGSSYAYGISCDGTSTYICGYAYNFATQREEAILWVRTVGVACVSDINRDGQVGGADLGELLSSWGPSSPAMRADLDGSGVVDGADLGRLMTDWGPCP